MVLRDKITKVIVNKESDGCGGFVYSEEERTPINCKASFDTRPETATAYGLSGEQVLYVVTTQALDKEAFYYFQDKKYSVRFQTQNNRFFYTTLIEIKKGA